MDMSSTKRTLLPSHQNLTCSCYEKLLSWHLTTNTRSLVTPKKKPWILLIRDFIVLFRSDIQNGHIYLIVFSSPGQRSYVLLPSLSVRGSCVVPFQNCVWHPCPPFKMATVTKNRNFYNCLLLLYNKSKWVPILTTDILQWVV